MLRNKRGVASLWGGLVFTEVPYKLVDAVNRHVPLRLGSRDITNCLGVDHGQSEESGPP